MKTKNLLTLIVVALFSTTTLLAQNHPPKDKRYHKHDKEKFQSMKIAYLTEKLSLTPDEAQKFWPVYNEYTDKKALAVEEFRKGKRVYLNTDETPDEEIEKMVNDRIILKQKELDLEKEYLARFKDILPIKKVGLLYQSEENFKRDLLRKIRPEIPTPPNPPKAPNPEK